MLWRLLQCWWSIWLGPKHGKYHDCKPTGHNLSWSPFLARHNWTWIFTPIWGSARTNRNARLRYGLEFSHGLWEHEVKNQQVQEYPIVGVTFERIPVYLAQSQRHHKLPLQIINRFVVDWTLESAEMLSVSSGLHLSHQTLSSNDLPNPLVKLAIASKCSSAAVYGTRRECKTACWWA